LQAACGAHVDDVLVDHEVATFDELDAHLACEERMLEVRAVVHAGREHRDRGAVARGRRRHVAQRAQQCAAVVIDRAHALGTERGRQDLHHRRAVLEHVADAARVADVVLEHAVDAVAVTYEIDAGDEAARTVRHRDVDRFAFEAGGRRDQPARDDAVVDRRLLTDVDVVEEAVQRSDPLREAAFDDGPLVRRDDPREQVHRPRALDALLFAVHGERDAAGLEHVLAELAAVRHVLFAEAVEALDQLAVVAARGAVSFERLVEEVVDHVAIEKPVRHVNVLRHLSRR
jgi:hypothetical protein